MNLNVLISKVCGTLTFTGIWIQCVLHIKIASPRTDVCQKCESLRCNVLGAVLEEEKLIALDNYNRHVEIYQGILILVSVHLLLCPNPLLSEHINRYIVKYKCIKINVG